MYKTDELHYVDTDIDDIDVQDVLQLLTVEMVELMHKTENVE